MNLDCEYWKKNEGIFTLQNYLSGISCFDDSARVSTVTDTVIKLEKETLVRFMCFSQALQFP